MSATTYNTPKEGAAMDTEYSKGKNATVPGSGVYRHPESGQTAIVQSDPLWGNTQAQAFARLGFKFERDATAEDIKTLPEMAMEARKTEEGSLKGLSARLDKLEDVAEENKTLTNEVAELRAKLEAAQKAQADAEKQIKDAGDSQVSDAQKESADSAKANAETAQASRTQATGSTNTNVNQRNGK